MTGVGGGSEFTGTAGHASLRFSPGVKGRCKDVRVKVEGAGANRV